MNPRQFPSDETTVARLPMWNPHAYAVFGPHSVGPWVDMFDVGYGVGSGEPVKVLITDCDRDDWEPSTPPPTEETE